MTVDRSTIDDFFESSLARGMQLSGDMLWGYFFVDTDREALEALRPVLVALGFRYVDVFGGDDDPDLYLHVERVEAHTPETLDARCRQLDELARTHGVRDYDGFDVGNVDGSGLIKN